MENKAISVRNAVNGYIITVPCKNCGGDKPRRDPEVYVVNTIEQLMDWISTFFGQGSTLEEDRGDKKTPIFKQQGDPTDPEVANRRRREAMKEVSDA